MERDLLQLCKGSKRPAADGDRLPVCVVPNQGQVGDDHKRKRHKWTDKDGVQHKTKQAGHRRAACMERIRFEVGIRHDQNQETEQLRKLENMDACVAWCFSCVGVSSLSGFRVPRSN